MSARFASSHSAARLQHLPHEALERIAARDLRLRQRQAPQRKESWPRPSYLKISVGAASEGIGSLFGSGAVTNGL
jgi:hypothetical protein